MVLTPPPGGNSGRQAPDLGWSLLGLDLIQTLTVKKEAEESDTPAPSCLPPPGPALPWPLPLLRGLCGCVCVSVCVRVC